MRIAFFVSAHGYGHAARSAAVAEAIRRLQPETEIEIVTEVPTWFFEDSLSFDFDYTRCETDVGLAQTSALDENLDGTRDRLAAFWPPAGSTLDAAATRLDTRSTDLIVADISPLGLAVAERSGIPAVLIENFTWDWIYEHQVGGSDTLAPWRDAYRELYREVPLLTVQATPYCRARDGATRVAPISRRPRQPADAVRERLEIEADRPSVLVTMGGFSWDYGFRDALRARPEVVFVIPGGDDAPVYRDNLRLLPHRSAFFHPDLVGAVDIVAGKVGYSTLAEAYAARARFVFLERPRFAESRVLTAWMEERLPTLEISRAEFEEASWLDRIDGLLARPRPELPTSDGAAEAARAILSLPTA